MNKDEPFSYSRLSLEYAEQADALIRLIRGRASLYREAVRLHSARQADFLKRQLLELYSMHREMKETSRKLRRLSAVFDGQRPCP